MTEVYLCRSRRNDRRRSNGSSDGIRYDEDSDAGGGDGSGTERIVDTNGWSSPSVGGSCGGSRASPETAAEDGDVGTTISDAEGLGGSVEVVGVRVVGAIETGFPSFVEGKDGGSVAEDVKDGSLMSRRASLGDLRRPQIDLPQMAILRASPEEAVFLSCRLTRSEAQGRNFRILRLDLESELLLIEHEVRKLPIPSMRDVVDSKMMRSDGDEVSRASE